MRALLVFLSIGCFSFQSFEISAETRKISIVTTADFHGALEGIPPRYTGDTARGGIDMLAAYVRAVKATNAQGFILVDAGDIYQGTLLSAHTEGKPVIGFYNHMGYDAAVVGNHEFDFGPIGPHSIPVGKDEDPLGVIKQRIREAAFPFLGANIYDKHSNRKVDWQNLRSHIILSRRGIRVGIIGLSSARTSLVTHPTNVRGLKFAPLLETLRLWLPRLKSRGATVLVMIAHAGVEVDGSSGKVTGELAELAQALKPGEVDILIGGHTHTVYAGRINAIPVIQAKSRGRSLAWADLEIDARSGRVVENGVVLHDPVWVKRAGKNGNYPVFRGKVVRPVPGFKKKVLKLKKDIAALVNRKIGKAARHMPNRTKLDSPAGRLVCDAMRESDKSIEFAMHNSGGVRAPIPKGLITFGSLYEVLPFDNRLICLSLTGGQIRRIIEHGLRGPYGVMEISGLKVVLESKSNRTRDIFVIHTESGRVLDEKRHYRVAVNDFVYYGGDGYPEFLHAGQVDDTARLIRDVVIEYIQKRGEVVSDVENRYQYQKTAYKP